MDAGAWCREEAGKTGGEESVGKGPGAEEHGRGGLSAQGQAQRDCDTFLDP